MGLVFLSSFFGVFFIVIFQYLLLSLIFSLNLNTDNFELLKTYWSNNFGILMTFLLLIALASDSLSIIITYCLLCIIFYHYESAKLIISINGVKKYILYPLSWYTKDILKVVVDVILNFNFIEFIKETAITTAQQIKDFIISEIKFVLHVFNFKKSIRDESGIFYQVFLEFQKIFFNANNQKSSSSRKHTEESEEFRKKMKNIRDNNDPSIMLNRLRRLPIVTEYTIQLFSVQQLFVKQWLVLYNFFKSSIIAIFIMILYFIYSAFFFKVQFLKQLSVWFIIGMLFFWLISGFNFFLKRYQFGKFTSSIQRFWKRTNTCFWLIEGFLILLFFYYYLNSSQEPVYMYDYSSLNQEYLVSAQTAGLNIIILSLVIYFMYFTMLRLNSNSWVQLNLYILFISIFIFFSFFIETYQFYYVISTFNERLWMFNEEENLWILDIENPILRNKNQYLLVCLIAKYWHFLFIFLSWVFFLIKSFERRKYTFVLFGANLQNIILLYILNFACYFQWFKWLSHRFLDLPYTWFMVNIDTKLLFRLFNELKLFIYNFFNIINSNTFNSQLFYKSINYWAVDCLVIWKFI